MEKEYIPREAAMNALCCGCGENGECGTRCAEWNAIASIPAADVVPVRWIPTTERLPEDGDNVIVCTKSRNVAEAKYQAALGYDLDFPAVWFLLNDYGNQYQTEEIVAWMPLPEPPKEET